MDDLPPKKRKGWPTVKPPSGIPARGPGWGGDARAPGGAPQPYSTEHQMPQADKAAAEAVNRTARELAIAHREAAIAVLARVMNDPLAPPQTQADAANKMLNRSDGTPAATVDVTSAGRSIVTWEDGT